MSSSSPYLSKMPLEAKLQAFSTFFLRFDLLLPTSSLAPLELFVPLDEVHAWMSLFEKSPKFYFLKEGFLQTQDQGGKLETSNFLKIKELKDQRPNLEEARAISQGPRSSHLFLFSRLKLWSSVLWISPRTKVDIICIHTS